MPRESATARQRRVDALIESLRATYPQAHCELRFSNPLELLVATILSAQCTDRQVNIVTESLFQKYPSARDYAESDLETLTLDVRRIGLSATKPAIFSLAAECCKNSTRAKCLSPWMPCSPSVVWDARLPTWC